MLLNRRFFANQNGIPCVESNTVTVNADSVVFNFDNHPVTFSGFQGLILVKINNAYEQPADALPIRFFEAGVNTAPVPLVGYNGEPVTTADFESTGVFLCLYDRRANVLYLLTGLSAAAPAAAQPAGSNSGN